MKNKHVIVVSVDAMVFEDLEYARELPHFKKLLEGGSLIERVTTIYPSLTHPVHATLLTGAPAGVTGVIRNEILTPGKLKGLPWYNLLSDIKCDTILHAAKRAGLTTACCTWPLTAKGASHRHAEPSYLNRVKWRHPLCISTPHLADSLHNITSSSGKHPPKPG